MYLITILISLLLCFFLLYFGEPHFLGAVVFLAYMAGTFSLLVLNRPLITMLAAVFSMSFTIMLSPEMGFSYRLVFVFIPLWSIYHVLKNLPSYSNSKLFYLLLLWLASYWLILFLAKPYPLGFIGMLFVHWCLFAWGCTTRWDSRKIVLFACIYGSYLIFFGMMEKLLTGVERVGGPTTFATGYAMLISVLWSIIFVESCVSRRFHLFVLIFISAFFLFAILLSGSRMGLIGIGMGFLIGIFSRAWVNTLNMPLQKKISFLAGSGIIGIAIIFAVWSLIPEELLIMRHFNVLLSGNIDDSTFGRITAWAAAWDAFSKNILWGNGPHTFKEIHGAFLRSQPQIPAITHMGYLPVAHNVILNILAENGIIAFVNLFVAGIICVWQCFRFLIENPENSLSYSLLAGFTVLFSLEMIDGSPSNGFDPLFYGIMFSLGIRKVEKRVNLK